MPIKLKELDIESRAPLLHWNYFLALESDMSQIARFIEFAERNFSTHSIELAHLLLAASSEVDVVAKQICALVDPNSPAENINDYHQIITTRISEFSSEEIFIPRHGITLVPWTNWANESSPFWWKSYNHVKHKRALYFEEANLKNALNALAALLVAVFYFYKLTFQLENPNGCNEKETSRRLEPESQLFRLRDRYYYSPVVV